MMRDGCMNMIGWIEVTKMRGNLGMADTVENKTDVLDVTK